MGMVYATKGSTVKFRRAANDKQHSLLGWHDMMNLAHVQRLRSGVACNEVCGGLRGLADK
jgi:hypothetical protein